MADPKPEPAAGEIADDFAAAMRDVAPIRPPAKVVIAPPAPPPVPAQTRRDEAAVLADSLSDPLDTDVGLEIGDEVTYRRDGIAPDVLRKLRRGTWAVQDHLDLHGLTVDAARVQLVAFLADAVKSGMRCVRIVHGKGWRSVGGVPVLKGKVAHWLRQKDEVLAYVQARPEDGGGGALLVLLKSGTRPAR